MKKLIHENTLAELLLENNEILKEGWWANMKDKIKDWWNSDKNALGRAVRKFTDGEQNQSRIKHRETQDQLKSLMNSENIWAHIISSKGYISPWIRNDDGTLTSDRTFLLMNKDDQDWIKRIFANGPQLKHFWRTFHEVTQMHEQNAKESLNITNNLGDHFSQVVQQLEGIGGQMGEAGAFLKAATPAIKEIGQLATKVSDAAQATAGSLGEAAVYLKYSLAFYTALNPTKEKMTEEGLKVHFNSISKQSDDHGDPIPKDIQPDFIKLMDPWAKVHIVEKFQAHLVESLIKNPYALPDTFDTWIANNQANMLQQFINDANERFQNEGMPYIDVEIGDVCFNKDDKPEIIKVLQKGDNPENTYTSLLSLLDDAPDESEE